jgi:hypothetical protein
MSFGVRMTPPHGSGDRDRKREDPSCRKGPRRGPLSCRRTCPELAPCRRIAGRLSWLQRAGPSATLDKSSSVVLRMVPKAARLSKRGTSPRVLGRFPIGTLIGAPDFLRAGDRRRRVDAAARPGPPPALTWHREVRPCRRASPERKKIGRYPKPVGGSRLSASNLVRARHAAVDAPRRVLRRRRPGATLRRMSGARPRTCPPR